MFSHLETPLPATHAHRQVLAAAPPPGNISYPFKCLKNKFGLVPHSGFKVPSQCLTSKVSQSLAGDFAQPLEQHFLASVGRCFTHPGEAEVVWC